MTTWPTRKRNLSEGSPTSGRRNLLRRIASACRLHSVLGLRLTSCWESHRNTRSPCMHRTAERTARRPHHHTRTSRSQNRATLHPWLLFVLICLLIQPAAATSAGSIDGWNFQDEMVALVASMSSLMILSSKQVARVQDSFDSQIASPRWCWACGCYCGRQQRALDGGHLDNTHQCYACGSPAPGPFTSIGCSAPVFVVSSMDLNPHAEPFCARTTVACTAARTGTDSSL